MSTANVKEIRHAQLRHRQVLPRIQANELWQPQCWGCPISFNGDAMKPDDIALKIIRAGVMCIGAVPLLVQLPFLLMQSHSWIDREEL